MAKRSELQRAPWFAKRSYRACIGWGAREWFLAISSRVALRSFIDDETKPELCTSVMGRFLADLGSNPMMPGGFTWSEPGRTSGLFLARGDWKDLGTLALQSPVTETSVAMWEYWAKAWGKNSRLLAVDLAAPDEAIRTAFARWLAHYRASERRIGLVSDVDFKAWTASYALAYIDIEQYSAGTGIKFTQAQIADALFPDAEVDRVEKLRKVTIKHARRMMAPELRERLAGQLGVDAPVLVVRENESKEPLESF